MPTFQWRGDPDPSCLAFLGGGAQGQSRQHGRGGKGEALRPAALFLASPPDSAR